MAIFIIGMRWPFRMVRGIFYAFNRCGFQCLVGVGQLFYRFVGRFRNIGEALRGSALSRTELAHFARIISLFVRLSLEITFSFGRSFVASF